MKRWIAIVVAVAAASVLGVGAFVALRDHVPSYASLRLGREEEIPGSLGFFLEPPPDEFEPAISPETARKVAAGTSPPPPGVREALASVPEVMLGTGDRGDVMVWAVVARKICYFDNKGDLVSSSRSAPAEAELPTCTRKNISVVLVDARTGKALAAIRGYDLSGTWVPPVASP